MGIFTRVSFSQAPGVVSYGDATWVVLRSRVEFRLRWGVLEYVESTPLFMVKLSAPRSRLKRRSSATRSNMVN